MIELAIVGAGSMGANHARVAMALRDARVAVIVDPDPSRGSPLAERIGARYSPDVDSVIGMIDAAVVAVPTPLHHRVGEDLLGKGIHVLVEKPIAATVEDGRKLVAAAEESQCVLMIGHVERFNPAVLELDGLLDRPQHVEARRISPYSARIADGVTLDLMIHDLDLVQSIAGSPVREVHAVTRRVRSDREDIATVLLRFENDMTATLTASRLGQEKIRELAITQPDNYVKIDLIRQDVSVHRVREVEFTSGSAGYRETGMVEIPFLRHRGEPLLLELEHFVDCVISGSPPRVPGSQGVATLQLVERVLEAASETFPYPGSEATLA